MIPLLLELVGVRLRVSLEEILKGGEVGSVEEPSGLRPMSQPAFLDDGRGSLIVCLCLCHGRVGKGVREEGVFM